MVLDVPMMALPLSAIVRAEPEIVVSAPPAERIALWGSMIPLWSPEMVWEPIVRMGVGASVFGGETLIVDIAWTSTP